MRARLAAAEALGKLGDPRAVEPLISCLKDKDGHVRWTAAGALGKLGDPRAVEPLMASLKDQGEALRERAAETLLMLGKAAVQPLIACLEDQDSDVRWLAAQTLGKLGDARAVTALIACLKDPEGVVRDCAAEALGKLGDARAVEPLTGSLEDQDPYVRERAADALWRLVPIRLAVVNEQKSLHPWHQEIPVNARAPSAEDADLLLIVGEQRETVLSVHDYQSGGAPAPSVTRYQYDLDVRLIVAKTGDLIAAKRCRGSLPPEARSIEAYSITRLEGGRVSSWEVRAWLLPHLVRAAKRP